MDGSPCSCWHSGLFSRSLELAPLCRLVRTNYPNPQMHLSGSLTTTRITILSLTHFGRKSALESAQHRLADLGPSSWIVRLLADVATIRDPWPHPALTPRAGGAQVGRYDSPSQLNSPCRINPERGVGC